MLSHSRQMRTASRTTPHPLIQAHLAEDGTHASQALTRAVDVGRLLRIRRGVYLNPAVWLQAPPWDRHLLAIAATALWTPEGVFCRQTGLAAHGVHQLATPDAVHLRTWLRQTAGVRAAPRMTGQAEPGRVAELLRSIDETAHDSRRRLPGMADLAGVPTRRVFASAPMRAAAAEGLLPTPSTTHVQMPKAGSLELSGLPAAVEPLGLVLADTVPRMDPTAAAVVLDSVRSGRCTTGHRWTLDDVGAWVPLITSGRARQRWELAWARSDAGAESVGESLTRLRVGQLGFETPETQVEFILLDGSVARVDLFWRSAGIVGEFDGRTKYTRDGVLGNRDVSEVVHQEKVREDGLRELGLGVVRFLWQDLHALDALHRKLVKARVPRA